MQKNIYRYHSDIKNNILHDWYFEYGGCEGGPIHGRDNARKVLKNFKKDYMKLLKKYHAGNFNLKIFTD